MNTVESVLQFKSYRVLEAQFSANSFTLKQGEKVALNPAFKQTVKHSDDGCYVLVLSVQLGNSSNEGPLPFYINIEMEGAFILSGDGDPDELMQVNATAILFPYLRATLTMLTSLANINPIILPTFNLAKSFEESRNSGPKQPEDQN